jgi:hypothetical protein
VGGEPIGEQVDPGLLLDAPAEGRDPVVEGPGGDRERSGVGEHAPLFADRVEAHRLATTDRCLAQALDVGPTRRREVDRDLVERTVEREPLQHPGQAEAVVAVEVGDADRSMRWGDTPAR